MTSNTQPLGCRLHTGKVIHAAIEITLTNPTSGNQFQSYKPVRGKRPPRHSLTHGYAGTKETVNCGKCLARLNVSN